MTWGPLPPYKPPFPIRGKSNKFIDIEIFGTATIAGKWRTGAGAQRIEATSDNTNLLTFYSGDAGEVTAGNVEVDTSGSGTTRTIQWTFKAPVIDADDEQAAITLRSGSPDGSTFAPAIIFSRVAGSGGQAAYVGLEGGVDLDLATGSVLDLPNGAAAMVWQNWQTWTPTYTSITVGNGTVLARYAQIGDVVIARFKLTFGSSTSIDGSDPRISMPVTGITGLDTQDHLGVAEMLESGTAHYIGRVRAWSTTEFNVSGEQVDATYNKLVAISATVPFTWGTGDVLGFTAIYEAA
jgi:hypothetical protein